MSCPHFMIIGAAKAGTTTLYDDLAAHPDTHMPVFKEPNILNRAHDARSAAQLYEKHFSGAAEGKLCGEGSTYYTMLPTFPSVAALAREVCGPDLKIVYLMREPMARIKSHLAHDMSVGRLKHHDFNRAVQEDPRYLAWSDYPRQIAPWLEVFDRSSILALSFEAFVAERTECLRAICRHLGINPALLSGRTGAKNTRGSQRQLRLPFMARMINSPAYQNGLRRLIPNSIVQRSRILLTKSKSVPEITFAKAEAEAITARLGAQRAALAKLGIDTYPGDISPPRVPKDRALPVGGI